MQLKCPLGSMILGLTSERRLCDQTWKKWKIIGAARFLKITVQEVAKKLSVPPTEFKSQALP